MIRPYASGIVAARGTGLEDRTVAAERDQPRMSDLWRRE